MNQTQKVESQNSNLEQPKETWREIWTRKGKVSGSREDLLSYNGYEATQIDMPEVVAQIVKALDIKPTDKVLEVGCGAGALAQYLNCDYVGMDYSPSLVKKHIEILGNSVIVGEANDIPFKDKSFDKVICYGVFLYFDSEEYAQQAISELKRVAKKALMIGELPIRSHRLEHKLYKKEDFSDWAITDGFYDPYRNDRFNVTIFFHDC
ncbi:class I SAM-dependent methyltransferase [Neobacillus bataviensis]|uniref:class I SAM-dependent methyltransferase n=1 Tax=Neobacillus bataviensis TaxID=220685 RepID=UPI001CBF3107|nr:class I SAM-dependent methyltransferase [Neobacillus bataviensis]